MAAQKQLYYKIALALLSSLGLVLFFGSLDLIGKMIYDEVRYLPGSFQTLNLKMNENWTHPVFAKRIMGHFIQAFGWNPFGWRLGPAIAGSLVVAIITFTSYLFTQSLKACMLTFFLLITSVALLVQSRFGNIDIFMILFFFAGLPFWINLFLQKPALMRAWCDPILLGVLWGLSLGSKWGTAFPIFYLLLSLSFKVKSKAKIIGQIGITILLTYLLSQSFLIDLSHPDYAPQMGETKPRFGTFEKYQGVLDLFTLQKHMFDAQVSFENTITPDHSKWWQWPILPKAIVYFIESTQVDPTSKISTELQSIVFLFNPLTLYLGIFSIGFLFFRYFKTKHDTDLVLPVIFLSLWLPWALVPRQTFYAYYFLPAFLVYPISISVLAQHFSGYKKTLSVLIGLIAMCAILLGPMTFGFKISPESARQRLFFIHKFPF